LLEDLSGMMVGGTIEPEAIPINEFVVLALILAFVLIIHRSYNTDIKE
jgi:hypothetical protein